MLRNDRSPHRFERRVDPIGMQHSEESPFREIAVPDDRGVTHMGDLLDDIARPPRRVEPNSDQAGGAPRRRRLEAR
jgi:hypothetical protein